MDTLIDLVRRGGGRRAGAAGGAHPRPVVDLRRGAGPQRGVRGGAESEEHRAVRGRPRRRRRRARRDGGLVSGRSGVLLLSVAPRRCGHRGAGLDVRPPGGDQPARPPPRGRAGAEPRRADRRPRVGAGTSRGLARADPHHGHDGCAEGCAPRLAPSRRVGAPSPGAARDPVVPRVRPQPVRRSAAPPPRPRHRGNPRGGPLAISARGAGGHARPRRHPRSRPRRPSGGSSRARSTRTSRRSLPLEQITLGGEATPAPLLDELRRLFPGARLSQVYASTEFGSSVSVRDGENGLPASRPRPRRRRRRADAHRQDGELWVRSRIGMLGYHGDDDADDGWRPTGDLVERRGRPHPVRRPHERVASTWAA